MTAYELRISDWSSDVCSSVLLRAELLGHRLQSAGCVHGIADGGERSRPAVAHLADDDGTTVQADADAQRLRQVVRQAAVQLVERLRHAARRFEGVAAALLDALLDAAQRPDRRASWRERGCQYGVNTVVRGCLK